MSNLSHWTLFQIKGSKYLMDQSRNRIWSLPDGKELKGQDKKALMSVKLGPGDRGDSVNHLDTLPRDHESSMKPAQAYRFRVEAIVEALNEVGSN